MVSANHKGPGGHLSLLNDLLRFNQRREVETDKVHL